MKDKNANFLVQFLGADWWGSDARALAIAMRQAGNSLIELNFEDFLPSHWSSPSLRILRRVLTPLLAREYNNAILRHLENSAVDFLLVFKGKYLRASTLKQFVRRGTQTYCFYPDVSFLDHGKDISECLPLYDAVFTTKSFHMQDHALSQRLKHLQLISHGFDPDVHRPLESSSRVLSRYSCDVSFVGCWSPKKEQILHPLANDSKLDLRIWGPAWGRAAELVRGKWQGHGAYGDELSLIYSSSKINLGLLSEAGGGTTCGDQVTVRTWQIPAAGGFMLHEETDELKQFFLVGEECDAFQGPDELLQKIRYYLGHALEREKVAFQGMKRCKLSKYTYANAAADIIRFHISKRNAKCPLKL